MIGASRISVFSLFTCLLMMGWEAQAQQKPQGSKLFPEIFDDNWTPPTRPEPKPIEPATKPVSPTPVTPTPPVVPPKVPNDAPQVKPPTVAPPTVPVPSKLLDIPTAENQANSRNLMREVFAVQLADKSLAGRRKLLNSLLAEAAKAHDNPVDRYVLLIAIAQATRDLTDIRILSQTTRELGANYKIDALAIKADVMSGMNFTASTVDLTIANLNAGLIVVDELLEADDLDGAAKVIAAMHPATATHVAARQIVVQRAKDIAAQKASEERAAQASARLKESPGDAAAQFAVGSHLCFFKRDWNRGLPLLAGCNVPLVKAAAIADIDATGTGTTETAAETWWNAADREPPGAVQNVMRQRAGHWYRATLDRGKATGLHRSLIEKRMEVVGDASRPTDAVPLVNSVGMKLVPIRPGTFMMGTPESETGRREDEVQHQVTLTHGFMMSTTEVTQKQWTALMGSNPSRYQGDRLPVEMVTWDDAVQFCKKLSEKEGKRYRLPTEAEWEYACRAGTTTCFNFGANDGDLHRHGNYCDLSNTDGAHFQDKVNSDGHDKTAPVGSFRANAWGLHDMHGNVREWCSDWLGDYPTTEVADPKGPDNGSIRIQRGGSWNVSPRDCRSGGRRFGPAPKSHNVGFRVVLDLN